MAARESILGLYLRSFRQTFPHRYQKWRQMCRVLYQRRRDIALLPGATLSGLFVANALSLGLGKKVDNASDKGDKHGKLSLLIQEADRLYDEHKIDELYEMLYQYKESNDADLLWRLARAMCDKGKAITDLKEKEVYFRDALKYAAKSLCIDENNYACHKWYAFMLNYLTSFVSTKESLENAYVIKNHLLKATELNPKDATTIHALGYWCYTFADLKWYERQLATVLFGKPPTSTFEEALKYFLEAEETDPDFYSMNLLMIGKTYLRLQNVKMAYLYLSRAGTYLVKTEDDKVARQEATELMNDLLKQRK